MHVPLHFAERALALHLLLQRLESLIDVVVADENLNQSYLSYYPFPLGQSWGQAAANGQMPCPQWRGASGMRAAKYQRREAMSTADRAFRARYYG